MRDVVMNDKTNLLQLEEHFYQLVDVDEPNTFRNLFPYEEIPKIAFNDRIVPHNMPEDIWIPIRHSVTDSSHGLHIQRNRLSLSMTIYIN